MKKATVIAAGFQCLPDVSAKESRDGPSPCTFLGVVCRRPACVLPRPSSTRLRFVDWRLLGTCSFKVMHLDGDTPYATPNGKQVAYPECQTRCLRIRYIQADGTSQEARFSDADTDYVPPDDIVLPNFHGQPALLTHQYRHRPNLRQVLFGHPLFGIGQCHSGIRYSAGPSDYDAVPNLSAWTCLG